MSTMHLDIDAHQTQSIAMGAAIGAGMFAIVGAIASVIQAHQAMAALEQRMAEWENPGLIYEPIRREFVLAQLSEIEQYLFTRLPEEISTLRKINIDLHRIGGEPFSVFDELVARIKLAGEGLFDDQKAAAFAESVDKAIPAPVAFRPEDSPLHQPIEGLDLMRRQHEWLTMSVRGPVYGGSYDQPSDQRDKSGVAMWREILTGKERMESIAQQLAEENRTISDELTAVKDCFKGLIALYQLAVLAYNDEATEEAVSVFAKLYQTWQGSPKGFDEALALAERLAAQA